MQTTYWAIAILLVLDIGVVILACQLDKRWYGHVHTPFLPGHFFLNKGYDDRVSRLLLSKGSMTIIGLVLLASMLLSGWGHGAF
jgi:hypothetical protein